MSDSENWRDGLKPARSHAEITRVRQGWALIVLNLVSICIVAAVALRTFGLI